MPNGSMDQVNHLMHQAVADGVFPGGVLLVSKKGRICFQGAYGSANAVTGEPVTMETVFDLASLTKPLATTPVLMNLVRAGRLKLEDQLSDLLPGLEDSDKAAIQIEHLLRHTSGLPDYRPYFETVRTFPENQRKKQMWRMLAGEAMESRIGAETRYSDLGFLMLQQVIETISETDIDRVAGKTIFERLGLTRLFFSGSEKKKAGLHFAATEDCPWRRRILQGEVHDENAWVIGGAAGHAGLFGDVASVHHILAELLRAWHGESGTSLFSPDLVRQFLSSIEPDGRAMGFDSPLRDNPSCGRHFSPRTVGHLGFTGTSFWMDQEKRIIVVLLTNRIHPSRHNWKIREFRPLIHDAVMEALL